MPGPIDVLRFWLEGGGTEGWYVADPEIDGAITARFGTLWEELREQTHEIWGEAFQSAAGLSDRSRPVSRNMFGGRPEAFATDDLARQMARRAVMVDRDLTVKEPERVFFYMPLNIQIWPIRTGPLRFWRRGSGP
ncbi:MAG: DUF924 family protein [Paracoccaceae bacterium]